MIPYEYSQPIFVRNPKNLQPNKTVAMSVMRENDPKLARASRKIVPYAIEVLK